MAFGINLWNANPATGEAYKNGYSDCEKKYKKLQQEYDTAVRQLKKLGYEIGESPDVLRSASVVAKHCKSNIDCSKCEFHIRKEDQCSLNGSSPADWRIM